MRLKLNSKLFSLAIAAVLLPLFAFAYTSPGKPQGFVNDFAGVLSASTKTDVENTLKSLNQESGVQISVVTIKSLGDETVETYAVKLFEEWGIGNKEKDNGLLILVAPNDRQARIEVGYGLEGTITDLQSGNIIRKVMIPAFQANDYDGGVKGAVQAVSDILQNSPDAAEFSSESIEEKISGLNINFFSVFFIIIVILNILSRILGRTKSWWLGGVLGAGLGAVIGLIFGFIYAGFVSMVVLTIAGLIFDFVVSNRPPGSGGRGGGIWPIFMGGGRSGFGGGGFGGFGGGGSGGGGASGRW